MRMHFCDEIVRGLESKLLAIQFSQFGARVQVVNLVSWEFVASLVLAREAARSPPRLLQGRSQRGRTETISADAFRSIFQVQKLTD
jgi:hypothetical protein